jgi:acyl dehydratase
MLPERLEITAKLDDSPRYRGTSHDDATARAMGFPAALIPGAFVYGHMTRMAVIGWGLDWLARGSAAIRFRRPVYNGDPLVLTRGAPERDGEGIAADVTILNATSGEAVATGRLGLPDRAPVPPAGLSARPPGDKRPVGPGDIAAGERPGSRTMVLTEALVAESRAAFAEDHPIYAERGLIHSGMLLRQTMGDTLGNYALPVPVIFAGAEVQNYAPVPVGAEVSTSIEITRAYIRNDRHYFESTEYLLTGGQPVARHVRQNLYA